MDHTQRDIPGRLDKIGGLDEIGQIRGAVANVIARRRHRKRWSQVELGGYSGLDNSYISRLEKGLMTPTVDSVFRLAKAFGIVPERLIKEMRIELEKMRG